ncbi:MAG: hypothetical protein WCO33_02330 [bacterium]
MSISPDVLSIENQAKVRGVVNEMFKGIDMMPPTVFPFFKLRTPELPQINPYDELLKDGVILANSKVSKGLFVKLYSTGVSVRGQESWIGKKSRIITDQSEIVALEIKTLLGPTIQVPIQNIISLSSFGTLKNGVLIFNERTVKEVESMSKYMEVEYDKQRTERRRVINVVMELLTTVSLPIIIADLKRNNNEYKSVKITRVDAISDVFNSTHNALRDNLIGALRSIDLLKLKTSTDREVVGKIPESTRIASLIGRLKKIFIPEETIQTNSVVIYFDENSSSLKAMRYMGMSSTSTSTSNQPTLSPFPLYCPIDLNSGLQINDAPDFDFPKRKVTGKILTNIEYARFLKEMNREGDRVKVAIKKLMILQLTARLPIIP